MQLIYNKALGKNGVKCSKSQKHTAKTFCCKVWWENYDIDYMYSEYNKVIKEKILKSFFNIKT